MNLTTFLVVLLAATAHGLAVIQQEIRLAPGYIDLTECQQYCIAGRLSWDSVDDYASWATRSPCQTKTCICGPETQVATEVFIGVCQKGFSPACAVSTVELNGAVRWVAGYCGWGTVMTPTLSVSSPVTSPVSQGPDMLLSSDQWVNQTARKCKTIPC